MEKYVNINRNHINLKYIDTDTNEVLFEFNDKSWMDAGQFMSDVYVTQLMNAHFDGGDLPENVYVLATAELQKVE